MGKLRPKLESDLPKDTQHLNAALTDPHPDRVPGVLTQLDISLEGEEQVGALEEQGRENPIWRSGEPPPPSSLPQCPRPDPYLDISVDLPLRMQVVQPLGTEESP